MLLVCLIILSKIKLETKAIQVVILSTDVRISQPTQPAIALVSMTGGRPRSSRGARSSNSISPGVKTRAAKTSGVGAAYCVVYQF